LLEKAAAGNRELSENIQEVYLAPPHEWYEEVRLVLSDQSGYPV
jgi:hypothetical protein